MNVKKLLITTAVVATPILGGLAAVPAFAAPSSPAPSTSVSQVAPGSDHSEATSPEKSSVESDGPGGHADANGSNVDHQFNGQE